MFLRFLLLLFKWVLKPESSAEMTQHVYLAYYNTSQEISVFLILYNKGDENARCELEIKS